MLVSEILAIKGKVLFTVSSNRTLSEAVAVMTEQDVGSLVVFDKGRMVGLLTFREVLVATQKAGADWQACRWRGHAQGSRGGRRQHADGRAPPPDGREPPALPAGDGRHDPDGRGVLPRRGRAVLEEQSFENRMLKNYIRNWPAEEDAV
jgi:hypothetical protein